MGSNRPSVGSIACSVVIWSLARRSCRRAIGAIDRYIKIGDLQPDRRLRGLFGLACADKRIDFRMSCVASSSPAMMLVRYLGVLEKGRLGGRAKTLVSSAALRTPCVSRGFRVSSESCCASALSASARMAFEGRRSSRPAARFD